MNWLVGDDDDLFLEVGWPRLRLVATWSRFAMRWFPGLTALSTSRQQLALPDALQVQVSVVVLTVS